MKALILAAGYAKRLYPHIKNIPKPLLPIVGRPIIELILSKIDEIDEIEKVLIVTNDLYYPAFEKWRDDFNPDIKLISDGTRSNQQSRGAIGNLNFVVNEKEKIDTDLLVIAGDNFFEFSLQSFLKEFKKKRGPIVALHDLKDRRKLLKRFGVVKLDKKNRIVRFEEKPEIPETTLASTLCYIFTPKELKSLKEFVRKNPNTDYTGSFIKYLSDNNHTIYGYKFSERWFDIGNYDEYRGLIQTELKKKLEGALEFSQTIDAIILFADIVGSATISEYTSEENYDSFICEFQEIALGVIDKNLKKYGYDKEDRAFCEYSVRGDEAVFILYTKNPGRDVKTAIETAIELKRKCFLSKFNRNRKGRTFYDVGIGIHYGSVVLKRHPSVNGTNKKFNAEGYAINLTKRIEGYSRNGKFSKIMLSKKIRDLISQPMILSDRIDVPLKGIYGSNPIYELLVYGNTEDPEYALCIEHKDIDYYIAALESSSYDMWLLLMVARYYYDEEDHFSAQKYYRESIERYPGFVMGYLYLGRSLYRQNKFEEAEPHLQKAYDLAPDSSRTNNFLAINLRRLEEYEDALKYHENAIKLEPNSPYEYNSFAYTIAEAYQDNIPDKNNYDLENAKKNLEEAERLFGKKKEKFQYILKHTRGLIFLKEKRYDEAIVCFKKVIECVRNDQEMMPNKSEEKRLEALYHMGIAHFEKEKTYWSNALEYFKQSVKSPKIQAGERIEYYWFNDSKRKIEDIEGSDKQKRDIHA